MGRSGTTDVWLPGGPVCTEIGALDRHQAAAVLQLSLGDLERAARAGRPERIGLRRTWVFDPQDVADCVVRDVEAGRLSPLAVYVLRLLLAGRIAISPPLFDGELPPSLVRMLDAHFALHSPQGSQPPADGASTIAVPSIETKAWNERPRCTVLGGRQ